MSHAHQEGLQGNKGDVLTHTGKPDAPARYEAPAFSRDEAGNWLSNLPTADPHVVGAAWNNAGTVKVSAG